MESCCLASTEPYSVHRKYPPARQKDPKYQIYFCIMSWTNSLSVMSLLASPNGRLKRRRTHSQFVHHHLDRPLWSSHQPRHLSVSRRWRSWRDGVRLQRWNRCCHDRRPNWAVSLLSSFCLTDLPTLNASLISSSESVSFIFLAIIVRNSGNPLNSKSQSLHRGVHTWEINGAIVISVNLVDHILQLRLRGVLAEGSHNSSEFLGSDLS